jgi:hypothetical protein
MSQRILESGIVATGFSYSAIRTVFDFWAAHGRPSVLGWAAGTAYDDPGVAHASLPGILARSVGGSSALAFGLADLALIGGRLHGRPLLYEARDTGPAVGWNSTAARDLAIALASPISWSSSGVSWPTAFSYALQSIWIGRRPWPDTDYLRYETGCGLAPAVSVIRGTASPQTASHVTADDLAAHDWVIEGLPQEHLIDVHDAQFAVSLSTIDDDLDSIHPGNGAWAWFASAPTPQTPPTDPPTPPPQAPPQIPPLSPSGDYVLVSLAGVVQWVPIQEWSCGE